MAPKKRKAEEIESEAELDSDEEISDDDVEDDSGAEAEESEEEEEVLEPRILPDRTTRGSRINKVIPLTFYVIIISLLFTCL